MGCRLPLLLLASFALLACSSTRNQGGGAVNVEFVHPEKYSDIALRDIPAERAREQLLPDLRRYLEKQAKLYIPADEVLDLRITDIDEAGWIRPLGAFPKRTVRQNQPARVDLEYTLTDRSGNTISRGRETLSDANWDRIDRSFDTEQLPLVKRMLSEWMRKVGRSPRK